MFCWLWQQFPDFLPLKGHILATGSFSSPTNQPVFTQKQILQPFETADHTLQSAHTQTYLRESDSLTHVDVPPHIKTWVMLLHLASRHAFGGGDAVVYGEMEEEEAAWSREGQTWSVLREANWHKPLLKLPACVCLCVRGTWLEPRGLAHVDMCVCVCGCVSGKSLGLGAWPGRSGEGLQEPTCAGTVRWSVMDKARQGGFPLFVWESGAAAPHTHGGRSLSPEWILRTCVCVCMWHEGGRSGIWLVLCVGVCGSLRVTDPGAIFFSLV